MAEGLIKCPFCGGTAKLIETRRWPRDLDHAVLAYSPACSNINCVIYNSDYVYFLTQEEAIKAWNKRVDK